MKPTLLVLAAGMGSRYGGLKQMDGLGPHGETIIDYSIHDAVEAGFGKVVYIVRESFKADMEKAVQAKYAGVKTVDGEPLQFVFVTQELNKIPARFPLNPERVKPWGTAHAVLMAKDVIHEPFAVARNPSASSATGAARTPKRPASTASSASNWTTPCPRTAPYPAESAPMTRPATSPISQNIWKSARKPTASCTGTTPSPAKSTLSWTPRPCAR